MGGRLHDVAVHRRTVLNRRKPEKTAKNLRELHGIFEKRKELRKTATNESELLRAAKNLRKPFREP
jgi:hypothetical protein